jgi:hypothetical protein
MLRRPWARAEGGLLALLLALLVGVTYWKFVGEYFHGGDTWPHIWTSRVSGPGDLARVLSEPLLTGTVFPDTIAHFYRPVSSLSYALDYAVFGMDAFAFHLTDLLIHVAATLLLCWLLTWAGATGPLAAAGAATFALHPVMVSVVPSLPRRHDSLAAGAMFGSLGLLCWACTHGRGRRLALAVVGALALFVFAAWAKEVGYVEVLLVAPVLVASSLANRLPLARCRARSATLAVACLGTAAALLVARVAVLGGIGGYANAPSPLVNVDVAISDYVQYLAWPFEAVVPRSPRGWLEVFGGLLIGSAVPWLFASPRFRMTIGLGWLWLLVLLAFQVGTRSLAPYQMYTAIAGLAFLVAGVLGASLDLLRLARRRVEAAAALVGLVAVAVLVGGVLRASALLTRYEDWHRAGELARQFLATVRPCLESLPPGAAVEFERYPGGIVDGTSNFVLLQPGILGDYSVGPAIYLTVPERHDLQITARSAYDLPRFPDAMRVRCEGNGATWRLTGEYQL